MVEGQHCHPGEKSRQPRRHGLETPLKLIESVAADQHADHIIALMQEQQVEFRVKERAEAMNSAVRNSWKSDTNRVSMHGDIPNAHGSNNTLAVLKAERKAYHLGKNNYRFHGCSFFWID